METDHDVKDAAPLPASPAGSTFPAAAAQRMAELEMRVRAIEARLRTPQAVLGDIEIALVQMKPEQLGELAALLERMLTRVSKHLREMQAAREQVSPIDQN